MIGVNNAWHYFQKQTGNISEEKTLVSLDRSSLRDDVLVSYCIDTWALLKFSLSPLRIECRLMLIAVDWCSLLLIELVIDAEHSRVHSEKVSERTHDGGPIYLGCATYAIFHISIVKLFTQPCILSQSKNLHKLSVGISTINWKLAKKIELQKLKGWYSFIMDWQTFQLFAVS